jgi:DNA-binding transcriptional ArsR family regulator
MAERHDTDVLFKALADPSRRKLLDLLEAANLVATVRRGREKLHFLNPVPLQAIYERWIAKFEKPRLKALSELKQRLEKAHG